MRYLSIILLSIFPLLMQAQKDEKINALLEEGIHMHDQGEYESALKKYDEALEIDKDNLIALAEKAMTLSAMGKYEEAIEICEKAISKHKKNPQLKTIYVTYGTSLNLMGKPEESVDIFNKGISKFPDLFLLHFNKGVTLSGMQKYEEAIESFEKSVELNPNHASSHQGIAQLNHFATNKKIPAILAYSRFLILEPQGPRAEENLENLRDLLMSHVKKTGEKEISVNLPRETDNKKEKKESFNSVEVLLAMSAAVNLGEKADEKMEVEKFIDLYKTICTSLNADIKGKKSFYWTYYAPYLVELRDEGHLETFGYIAFASMDDDTVKAWLKENRSKIEAFLEWSDNYKWK